VTSGPEIPAFAGMTGLGGIRADRGSRPGDIRERVTPDLIRGPPSSFLANQEEVRCRIKSGMTVVSGSVPLAPPLSPLYHPAMAEPRPRTRITRRTLLVGGGVGVGLLVAWQVWPRRYLPNLRAGPGERVINAFFKIGADGRVTVAVPQAELGQGVWTSLPQILADELGADWRTVAVEPAPIGPLYANAFLADAAADAAVPHFAQDFGRWAAHEVATREAMMATAGSTSIRAFEAPMREAGAGARALLMQAAARRWGGDWRTLDTGLGFVSDGTKRLRFAELAEAAASESLPDELPVRGGIANRLYGQSVPRLDLPSKVDGSAQFAGDVRLPDMVYASARSAPSARSRLTAFDKAAALKVAGVIGVYDAPGWVAAVGTNWWAANRGVEALAAAWETDEAPTTDAAIDAALGRGLGQEADTIFAQGDAAAALAAPDVIRATYSAGIAANAPLETLTATARWSDGALEIWAPTQAPSLARAAAARAAGVSETAVTLYATMIGGGYGRKLETRAIEQAAALAVRTKRPVQLVWSRAEESVQDSFRPPARANMAARLGEGGIVLGWQAKIAAPELDLAERLGPGARILAGPAAPAAGAQPPYDIPAVAVEHVPAQTHVRTGLWRSGAHSYTAFFTECFVDELARKANIEPLSFRMQMLGRNPRLARCLSTAATLGGWDGGQPGSSMGIACHAAFGSYIATVMEIEVDAGQKVRVLRAVCAVDCGRAVNPNILRQQIEGGLLFGIAAAGANPIGWRGGRPDVRGYGGFGFPVLRDAPEVTVELIESEEAPGGATELAVPTAAPAMANALFALTGQRLRSLPLVVGSGA
jgi:isoquinoline 1-oxidoreductase beta subunit